MFDPPPAKFGPVLSPKICAAAYLVSGKCTWVIIVDRFFMILGPYKNSLHFR